MRSGLKKGMKGEGEKRSWFGYSTTRPTPGQISGGDSNEYLQCDYVEKCGGPCLRYHQIRSSH